MVSDNSNLKSTQIQANVSISLYQQRKESQKQPRWLEYGSYKVAIRKKVRKKKKKEMKEKKI